MGQMWHSGVALIAVMVIGCSGGSDDPPALADAPEPDVDSDTSGDDSDAALEFAIDGRAEPLGAQARLDVHQGVERVHLLITGADGGSEFVMFDIYFAGIESTMGDHMIELGLPDRVESYVNASFGGAFYYSQGGLVELTLAENGAIQGRFEVNLAHDPTDTGGAQPVPSTDAMMLTGGFEGSWTLSCRSRLPGHDTLTSGGEFCENLEF